MATIQFSSQLQNDYLLLPGVFIDDYMRHANGEYVKVFLYLFRALSTNKTISLEKMAEDLDHTQRDIVRALYYWDKEQLIRLGFNSKQEITQITLLSMEQKTREKNIEQKPEPITNTFHSAVPISEKEVTTNNSDEFEQEVAISTDNALESDFTEEENVDTVDVEEPEVKQQPSYPIYQPSPSRKKNTKKTVASIEDLAHNENFSELCFLAQTYIKKTLTPRDTERIGYWYILYDCSFDIIEYLLEYCVEIGHPNINYMEKVVLNWHENGLRNVEEIKEYSKTYNKINFQIMRAFGMSDRSPSPRETQLIKKWTQDYGFDFEMIAIACERTLSAIQKPSFAYTDSILTAWNKNNCHTKADLEIYDANYQKTKQKDTTSKNNNIQNQNKQQPQNKPNKFHNFEQRTTDYNKLVADYYGYQGE